MTAAPATGAHVDTAMQQQAKALAVARSKNASG
jgi:hypothetical protein